MRHSLAHGRELLQFFLNRGYVIVGDTYGQVIICHREDIDTLYTPIVIPSNQPVARGLLRYILARGGFTEQEFWDGVGE